MFKIQDFMILGAAFISFLFSISLWFGAFWPPNRDAGIFVGLWVPSILAAGVYIQLRATRRWAMDLWIFAIGVGTFGLFMGGLTFTIREFRQMKPGDSDGVRERITAREFKP